MCVAFSMNAATYEDEDVVPRTKTVPDPSKRVYVVQDVDSLPQFPGGDAALYAFIQNNLNYPEQTFENELQGRVTVRFKVNEDGRVSNVQVARNKSLELDKEAVRVIEMLPDFKPAILNGKPVAVWYHIKVQFKSK